MKFEYWGKATMDINEKTIRRKQQQILYYHLGQ